MKTMLTLFALALSASPPPSPLTATSPSPLVATVPSAIPKKPYKIDANGDSSLSKDEFKAAPFAQKNPERAEKGFEAKDKDKDGKLSKEEFAKGGRKKDAPATPANPKKKPDATKTEEKK